MIWNCKDTKHVLVAFILVVLQIDVWSRADAAEGAGSRLIDSDTPAKDDVHGQRRTSFRRLLPDTITTHAPTRRFVRSSLASTTQAIAPATTIKATLPPTTAPVTTIKATLPPTPVPVTTTRAPAPPALPIVATTRTFPVIPTTSLVVKGVPEHFRFQQTDGKSCDGSSYTENPLIGCRGWTGLTQVQCQQKCSDNEAAPNCINKPCIAAVFQDGGQCDLYEPSQCQKLVSKASVHMFKKIDEGIFGPAVDGLKKAVNSPVGKGILEGTAVVAAVGAAAGGVAAAIASQQHPTTTTTTTRYIPPPTFTPMMAFTTPSYATRARKAADKGGSSGSSGGGVLTFFLAIVGCSILTCCVYFALHKMRRRRNTIDRDESLSDYEENYANDEDYDHME